MITIAILLLAPFASGIAAAVIIDSALNLHDLRDETRRAGYDAR